MDASAVFCLIIYRVRTVQTTNQFLFVKTAAEDSIRMLIFISAFVHQELESSSQITSSLYTGLGEIWFD